MSAFIAGIGFYVYTCGDDIMSTVTKASPVKAEPFENSCANAEGLTASGEFDRLLAQGTAGRKAGDHGGALYFFMKAAELKPTHNAARLEMAQSLVDLQRPNEAERIYCNILAIEPDCAAALIGMAHIDRERGNHERSCKWLGIASVAVPENLDIQAELAAEFLALSQYEQSELVYCKILETDPFHSSGLMGFGMALRRRGRRSEALSIFKNLLVSNPNSVSLLHEMARSLVDMWTLDEAREVYRQILELQPEDQCALSEFDRLTEVTRFLVA
jgi:tetratricopeptide (TPR) repeat protein